MEKQCNAPLNDKLQIIITNALEYRLFSACSVGYFFNENEKKCSENHHYGYTDKDEKGAKVSEKTVYDLASLTKPLVTSLAIMALIEKGVVALKDEIGTFFPGIKRDLAQIRLSDLLTHSSGLPAHRPYYEILTALPQCERNETLIKIILHENLLFKPGRGILYSDLGFILLGYIIEKITGSSLDVFWKKEIAQPLGLQKELFFLSTNGSGSDVCAVTGTCNWSKIKLCGIVHDDNCRALGGVAGHAGLFGTVSGVLSLAKNLALQFSGIGRHPAFSVETLRNFLRKKNGSTWAYGFDTPSLENSSSGKYFSHMSIGHLGFTGTSFWIDLLRGSAIVLLTNRVLMGNDLAPIKKFRPLIHDTIMEYMVKKPD